MHHELRTEVEIAAPTEAVWETLTDLAAYPDWNPFIVSAEGRATVGERLTNRLPPPGGKADGARVRGHERGAHGTCRSRRRVSVMTPPSMPGWNLALRFALELAALAGLAAAAWKLGSGPGRWIGVVAVPVAAATVWGVFNVLDDPSRSGAAPVEVSGAVRLTVELVILCGGAAAVAFAAGPALGIVFAVAIVGHHLASLDRIEWLVQA